VRRQIIRQIGPNDPIPTEHPKRYPNKQGYVRLRWRVGTAEYVECYEHRLVAGLPVGKHVHHKNEDKGDNASANLQQMEPRAHHQHHMPLSFDVEVARRAYEGGASLPTLQRQLGVHHTAIYRALKAVGVAFRPANSWRQFVVDEDAVRRMHGADTPAPAIAKALGVPVAPIRRVIRALGLPRRRSGAPSKRTS
jgi:hypothetical protein